jgi:prepilin peptidase CpaA
VSISIGLVLVVCFIASYFDVRARRIPNWLTGTLAVAALALNSFSGLRAVGVSIAVMAVLMLLGTFVYSRGGIGGGDIKLGVAASGVLSLPLCVPFLLYTMIGGGLLAIVFVLVRGNVRQTIWRTVAITAGAPGSVATEKAHSLPYAVAFAFGAVILALSQSVAPFLRIMS